MKRRDGDEMDFKVLKPGLSINCGEKETVKNYWIIWLSWGKDKKFFRAIAKLQLTYTKFLQETQLSRASWVSDFLSQRRFSFLLAKALLENMLFSRAKNTLVCSKHEIWSQIASNLCPVYKRMLQKLILPPHQNNDLDTLYTFACSLIAINPNLFRSL